MKYELFEQLKKVLEKDERLVAEGELLRNRIVELARQNDALLLKHLLADAQTKSAFFTDVEGVQVFDSERFVRFVNNKEFLPDSYTAFKNKIGLAEGDEFVSEKKEVVLNWPYKDCVLEGGQTKEDAKRDEVFWNETLAPDQIHRLLDPKVFTDFKRIDAKGERPLDGFKTDENGDIKDNLIIKGNNLLALHSLKARFAGRVKLIYIDPPYNTETDEFKYNDRFNHSTWLTFMRNRLEVAWDFLSPKDGILAVQSDYHEDAYLRVLLDDLFGKESYVQTVTVKMSSASGPKMAHAHTTIPKLTESIHIYSKGKFAIENIPRVPKKSWDKRYDTVLKGLLEKEGRHLEDLMTRDAVSEIECNELNKILRKVSLVSAKKVAEEEGQELTDAWREQNAWRIIVRSDNESLSKKLARLEGYGKQTVGCMLNTKNRLVLFKGDADVPHSTLVELSLASLNLETNPGDLWDDFTMGRSLAVEGGVLLSGGKKPEKLLKRIIEMFTGQGQTVLDFFVGTGTTCVVAHKIGRQYVGIEQLDYGENGPVARLRNTIVGDKSGVTDEVGWKGGGDFVYAELMPLNQVFKEKVEKAKDAKELAKVWDEIQEKGFLSYKLDMKEFNKEAKDFASLSLADQKHFILESLDYNQLYVNKSEIEDVTYAVSPADKKLNKEFYA